MSVFRYYLPGIKAADVTAQTLGEVGLADRLWDCIDADGNLRRRLAINDLLAGGPDGCSGTLIVPLPRSGDPVPRIGWHKDQTNHDLGKYHIITDPAHPPTPSGLERRDQVDGYVRQLGDGSHWLCPVIRSQLDQTDLPREYLQKGGEIFAQIQHRYHAIWTRSVKWCLRFLDQCRELPAPKYLGITEAFEGAVDCLALNYRVSAEELSLLPGLLTDQSLTSILDAAIDWDFFSDVDADDQKKTSLQRVSDAMRSLLASPEDSESATDRPAPVSNCSAAAASTTTPPASPSSPPEA